MDQAGQQATKRSIQTCLSQDANVEIITLPEGMKDVNDLVIEDPNFWKKAVENSSPVMNYLFANAFKKYSKDDPKGKKMIAYELLNVIRSIADPIEKNYWLKKLSDNLGVEEEVLTQVLERVKLKEKDAEKNVPARAETEEVRQAKPRIYALQERLLGLFVLFPAELGEHLSKTGSDIFEEKYLEIWEGISSGNKDKFSEELNQCEVTTKYSYDQKEGFLENEIDPFKEYDILVKEIHKERLKATLIKIAKDIKRAEEEKDEEALKLLMEEFSRASKQLEEYETE